MKITSADREYLLSVDVSEEDFPQMEEASKGKNTKYELHAKMDKDSHTLYKIRRLTQKEALALLGRNIFWDGISRSAFHWTALRKVPNSSMEYVFFDSSKYFKDI